MVESQTKKMRELHGDKELTAEQMEHVSGGNKYEIADDSRFLNVLLRGRPGQPDRYGEFKIQTGYGGAERCDEVMAAWATVGIKMEWNNGDTYYNNYYLDGKSITQEQAMEHAMKVVGKRLKKSDWYWPD